MSTTAAILELLVIGVQALIWVLMLACAVFGVDWMTSPLVRDFLTPAKELIGVLALCVAYPLGVLVDEFADEVVFGERYRAMRKKMLGEPLMFTLLMEPRVVPVRFYFDYSRTRIRLVRSACVNAFAMAVAGAALCVRVQGGWRGGLGVLFALVLAWSFWKAWGSIQWNQFDKTRRAAIHVGVEVCDNDPGVAT